MGGGTYALAPRLVSFIFGDPQESALPLWGAPGILWPPYVSQELQIWSLLNILAPTGFLGSFPEYRTG